MEGRRDNGGDLKLEQSVLLEKAETSYQAAKLLVDKGFYGISASRSFFTMYYIAQAFLLSKNLKFAKPARVFWVFKRKFIKTGIVPKEFSKHLSDVADDRYVVDRIGKRKLLQINHYTLWGCPLERRDIKREIYKEDAERHLEHSKELLDLALKLLANGD